MKFVGTGLELRGQTFEWDSEKAAINLRKHNVTFQEACEVFFDPFFCLVDATPRGRSMGSSNWIHRTLTTAVYCACGAPGANHPHHFGPARNDRRERNL
jgi:hypothetical protein